MVNAAMQDHYGVEDTLDERQWAKLAPMLGQPYYVDGQYDLRCSATTGQLSTTIAAGRAACYGFGADFAQQTIAHPVITSGARWDLVAMRYDWGPDAAAGGGNAYPVVIPGGATATLPPAPARKVTAGVTYDMPLALAYVVYGKAQVQQYRDLRRFPNPITARDPLTVPPEDLIDGLHVGYGGTDWYYRADTKRWVTQQVKAYSSPITAADAATVAKAPKSGRLLSQIVIPDPGFPYSIVVSGQLELDPAARTQVWAQYDATASMATATRLAAQFFTARGYAETKTLTTQFIAARTGQTVINLLASILDTDVKTGATYSVSPYNGRFQAMVIPL